MPELRFVRSQFAARHLLGVLLAGLCFGVGATELPAPFVAVYDVHHSGARVGETTIELSADDNGEQLMTTVTQPKGLAVFIRSSPVTEQSRFRWTPNGGLQSLEYTFDDGSRDGKRSSHVSFDWVKLNAASTYKNKDVDIVLTSPIGDRLALQALLMRDLLNSTLKSEYQIVDRNEIKAYAFKITGEEVLDTPAGRFNTLKILQHKEGSSRTTHIWASPDHGYATVKMAQYKDGKPRTVLIVRSIDSAQKVLVEDVQPQTAVPQEMPTDQVLGSVTPR